jgi:glycogen synthase
MKPDSPKQHVCHLSVLNPALHPRIFYKWSLSLVKLGHKVSIIAPDEGERPYLRQGVTIHPLPIFKRLSRQRWQVQQEIYAQALACQADVYVLHTPELLGLGLRLKQATEAKLVYDMHEDYAATLRASQAYPPLLRNLLAWWVRRSEQKALPQLDRVVYAEACYQDIMGAKTKSLVLENRFTPRAIKGKPVVIPPRAPYLLFTGTLAREWGVFKAIELWKTWRVEWPDLQLVLAGHTHNQTLLRKIKRALAKAGPATHWTLHGGDQFVPYADIVALIERCHAAVALYTPLTFLREKLPTKFFEALVLQRPLIYTDAPFWRKWGEAQGLGIPLKRYQAGQPLAVKELAEQVASWRPQPQPEAGWQWEAQEGQLAQMMGE